MSTRIPYLDTLRGVAIAGILLVNLSDMIHLDTDGTGVAGRFLRDALDVLVQGRFVPVFEVLFGVGTALVIRSARDRGVSPWPPMLMRLGALLGIGLVHRLVYPGEVLVLYAVVGLLVLPVVVWAPRLVQLVLGASATTAVVAIAGSSVLQTPGLFLVGAAGASYGVPAALQRGGPAVRRVLILAAVAAVVAVHRQLLDPGDPRFTTAGGRAGLAVVYVTGLAMILHGSAGALVTAVFAPLGRMALTNYVTASLVIVPTGILLGLSGSADLGPALLLAIALLIGQAVVSRLWLRRHRYGPIEWCWRAVTWRSRPGAPARV